MFYPSNPEETKVMIAEYLLRAGHDETFSRLIGVVVPHAGYVYSGPTAAYSYNAIAKDSRRRFVIIGPKHSGFPQDSCIYPSGAWKTPLGDAMIDEKNAKILIETDSGIPSVDGHEGEHSIEVQVPWLQHLFGESMRFVPICMGDQSLSSVEKIVDGLVKISDEAIVVASSDLDHYESASTVTQKDMEAIEAIESLDPGKLYEVVRKKRISACGYGPIASLMVLTRKLGGKMRLLHHSTSGDVSGDYSSAVGYSSIVAYIP